jgi:hypothetical protein
MTRLLGIVAFTFALVGLGPKAASAFAVERQPVSSPSGKWYPVRLMDGTRQIRFMMNDRPLDLLPNLAADSTPMAAIQTAMQSWAIGPIALSIAGTTSKTDVATDGVNLITFADTPKNRDATADGVLTTITPEIRLGNRPYWYITESDIIVNPTFHFATDGGSEAFDLQAIFTHELGHAQGLAHSADTAATMWPEGPPGQLTARVPEPDDVAAINSLYTGATDPDHGAVTGQVLGASGEPVFGAHVVALNPQGIVQVAGFTERDGSYTLPWLPEALYYIYAEPLDPSLTTADFSHDYYHGGALDFRTTFLGGNGSEHRVQVVKGKTASLDPISVDRQPPALTLRSIGWSPDGSSFSGIGHDTVEIQAGGEAFLAVVGDGLDTANEIGVTGRDIALDTSQAASGTTSSGRPYLILPLYASAGATPGGRTLLVDNSDELAAFTGAIKVVAP